jgi:hypothetical protein
MGVFQIPISERVCLGCSVRGRISSRCVRRNGHLPERSSRVLIEWSRRMGSSGSARKALRPSPGYPASGRSRATTRCVRSCLARCTHSAAEVLEYIKRDVANVALGNKDNHARNTALQRDFQGNIRLMPLYDFVQAYLHPDGIARRIRWEDNDHGQSDWRRVIDRVCELSARLLAQKPAANPARAGARSVCGMRIWCRV